MLRPAGIASTKDSFHALWIRTINTLRDYAQILIEKCNFTYVAETEDHQVVGFICGKYDKRFSKALAAQYETKSTMAVGVKCSSSSI